VKSANDLYKHDLFGKRSKAAAGHEELAATWVCELSVKLSALLMLIVLCRQAAAVLPGRLRQVQGERQDLQRYVGVFCIAAFTMLQL
jgi:hypothetical protein